MIEHIKTTPRWSMSLPSEPLSWQTHSVTKIKSKTRNSSIYSCRVEYWMTSMVRWIRCVLTYLVERMKWKIRWVFDCLFLIYCFSLVIDNRRYRMVEYLHHSSAGFFPLFFLRLVLLAFLVSKGERGARLIFFSEEVLTRNWLALTRFLPTLMWRWWMKTRAWWMDFAWKPSW